MTDYQERRQALRKALRREALDFSTTSNVLPATAMLYRGASFLQGSLALDAEHWAGEIASIGLRNVAHAARLRDYVTAIAPNTDAPAAAENVMAETHRLLRYPLREELDKHAIGFVKDALARAALYAWRLGSVMGALEVARQAFAQAQDSDKVLWRVRYLTTAAEALRTSRDGYDSDRYDHHQGKRIALAWLTGVAGDIADVVDIEREMAVLAQAAIDGDSRVGEHVKAQLKKLPTLAEKLGADPLAGLDDFEVEPEETAVAEALTGGVVVIGSLEHLPSSRTERGAPRQEFAPIEGVALPLTRAPDVAESSATLRAEFPWLADVVDRLLLPVVGRPHVAMPPTLLVGRAGCGKTALARRAAEVLGLNATTVPCGGVHDGSFGGTSRQWTSGRAAIPVAALLRARVANPCLILDEVEKASTERRNGSLHDVLLGMLDDNGNGFFDPYLEAPVRLDHIVWLATCNSTYPIKGPLLDRFVTIACPDPRPEDLDVIVAGILRDVRLRSGQDPRFVPDLDSTEWSVLRRGFRGGSLRPLRRAVERLLALRQTPGITH